MQAINLEEWNGSWHPRRIGCRFYCMEVTNLLDIHTRAELYRWYLENHDKVSDFWLRVNRAAADCPGVVRYVDAVEVALCFGWIDSTRKKIDQGKPIQHFTPRRKRSNWCERNLIRCRRRKSLPGHSKDLRLKTSLSYCMVMPSSSPGKRFPGLIRATEPSSLRCIPAFRWPSPVWPRPSWRGCR